METQGLTILVVREEVDNACNADQTLNCQQNYPNCGTCSCSGGGGGGH